MPKNLSFDEESISAGRERAEEPGVARGLSRRTVVMSAAWSVPVIAAAAAAPMAAASTALGATCTVGVVAPTARLSWSLTAGTLSTWDRGNTGWTPADASVDLNAPNRAAQSAWVGDSTKDGFVSSSDGGTSQTTVVALYTFTPTAGATYELSARIVSQTAYGTDGTLYGQWLDADILQGATTVPLAREIVGQTGVPTSGYSTDLQWGGDKTRTASFTAATAQPVTVRYTFNLPPMVDPKPTASSPGQVESDFWIQAPTATVTACA